MMFSNDLVVNILNYLDNNMYKKITIDELANEFHYNKDYIMRVFKKELGVTIIQYLNNIRIYNSLAEYKNSKISILNISMTYGFYSQEYYSEIFHQIMGVSPSIYHKFNHFSKYISEHQIYTIQSNLALLDYYIRNINKYRSNIPPLNTTKVYSIFRTK